ncbi:MAG: hypothetical protein JNK48_04415 [Bryobacterales bacterium]|nr:hypothetical protein [Bryobacterales bacterium]
MLRLLPVVAVSLWFGGCSQPKTETKKSVARQAETEANDIARFLAGVPGRADGPFRDLEPAAAWRRHKESFDRMWGVFEEKRLPAMRAFQEKELSGAGFSGDFVLYPFGGPDVLTVTTLFPKARNYVLIGLEPPGTLPSREDVLAADLERQLPRMEQTLDSLLRRSFFITASMDKELRGQITDGLLQVMLVQLARRGYTVLSHDRVTLNDAGELVARTGTVRRNRGVRIEAQGAKGEVARFVYLAANLNNKWLEENEPLRKFVARAGQPAAFFKSTSYMPHKREFSVLRDLILAHCRAVVQDDSGIPYKYVDRGKWDVRLYGEYKQPYGSFRYLVQKDLRKAYEAGAAPLGFRIGYGFGRVPSGLQVFVKKGPGRI